MTYSHQLRSYVGVGKTQVGSKGEEISVLGVLGNRYLARCQKILHSKNYLYIGKEKAFFNIVRDLFKTFEALRRNGKFQTGSTKEGFFVLGGLRKKY